MPGAARPSREACPETKQRTCALVSKTGRTREGTREGSRTATLAGCTSFTRTPDRCVEQGDREVHLRATTTLDDAHHAESNADHNFALPEQSLEDQLAQQNNALERGQGGKG